MQFSFTTLGGGNLDQLASFAQSGSFLPQGQAGGFARTLELLQSGLEGAAKELQGASSEQTLEAAQTLLPALRVLHLQEQEPSVAVPQGAQNEGPSFTVSQESQEQAPPSTAPYETQHQSPQPQSGPELERRSEKESPVRLVRDLKPANPLPRLVSEVAQELAHNLPQLVAQVVPKLSRPIMKLVTKNGLPNTAKAAPLTPLAQRSPLGLELPLVGPPASAQLKESSKLPLQSLILKPNSTPMANLAQEPRPSVPPEVVGSEGKGLLAEAMPERSFAGVESPSTVARYRPTVDSTVFGRKNSPNQSSQTEPFLQAPLSPEVKSAPSAPKFQSDIPTLVTTPVSQAPVSTPVSQAPVPPVLVPESKPSRAQVPNPQSEPRVAEAESQLPTLVRDPRQESPAPVVKLPVPQLPTRVNNSQPELPAVLVRTSEPQLPEQVRKPQSALSELPIQASAPRSERSEPLVKIPVPQLPTQPDIPPSQVPAQDKASEQPMTVDRVRPGAEPIAAHNQVVEGPRPVLRAISPEVTPTSAIPESQETLFPGADTEALDRPQSAESHRFSSSNKDAPMEHPLPGLTPATGETRPKVIQVDFGSSQEPEAAPRELIPSGDNTLELQQLRLLRNHLAPLVRGEDTSSPGGSDFPQPSSSSVPRETNKQGAQIIEEGIGSEPSSKPSHITSELVAPPLIPAPPEGSRQPSRSLPKTRQDQGSSNQSLMGEPIASEPTPAVAAETSHSARTVPLKKLQAFAGVGLESLNFTNKASLASQHELGMFPNPTQQVTHQSLQGFLDREVVLEGEPPTVTDTVVAAGREEASGSVLLDPGTSSAERVWLNDFRSRLQSIAQQYRQSMKPEKVMSLELQPEHLGRVEVSLTVDPQERVRALVSVHQAEALAPLEKAMAEANHDGLSVTLQLQSSTSEHGSSADTKNEQQEQTRAHDGSPDDSSDIEDDMFASRRNDGEIYA